MHDLALENSTSLPRDAELQFDKHSTCRRSSLSSGASNIRHFQIEKCRTSVGHQSVPPQELAAPQILIKMKSWLWTAPKPLQTKSTNPSRLSFAPSQSWVLDNILKAHHPSPQLETQTCHRPHSLPSMWGWGGKDYPAISFTAPLACENEPSHVMGWKRPFLGLAEN